MAIRFYHFSVLSREEFEQESTEDNVKWISDEIAEAPDLTTIAAYFNTTVEEVGEYLIG